MRVHCKRNQYQLYYFVFQLTFCSDDGEYESRLAQSKLLQLCEYDPIITFVKGCDQVLYQTLVEVLVPDVLRPIPGKTCLIFLPVSQKGTNQFKWRVLL